MTPELDTQQQLTFTQEPSPICDRPISASPPYEPPAIVYRAPLEATAAFCAVDFGGKDSGTCDGPINS